jgi:hypothetical protein
MDERSESARRFALAITHDAGTQTILRGFGSERLRNTEGRSQLTPVKRVLQDADTFAWGATGTAVSTDLSRDRRCRSRTFDRLMRELETCGVAGSDYDAHRRCGPVRGKMPDDPGDTRVAAPMAASATP